MKGHNGSLLANFQAQPSIKMFYGDDSFYFQGYLSHKMHQHSQLDEYGIFAIILHRILDCNTKNTFHLMDILLLLYFALNI